MTTLLSASEPSSLDTAVKIIGLAISVISAGVAIYVTYLNRRWKKANELEQEKQKRQSLELDNKLATFKDELKKEISPTLTTVSTLEVRLQQIEKSADKVVETSALAALKYSIETDLAELKSRFAKFRDMCSNRHEAMAAQGTMADLKSRVGDLFRKISELENFRHASADRYVLMVSYQQDVKLMTDAMNILREDLRAVIEMVENL